MLHVILFLCVLNICRCKTLGRHVRNNARNLSPRLCKISRQSFAIRDRWSVRAHLNLQINREHGGTDISAHARHPVSSYRMFARRVVTERRRTVA